MRLVKLVIGGALLAAACAADPGSDGAGDGSGDGATWVVDHSMDGGGLISIWGSGSDDVWAAGGTADRGLVLHNDGSGWAPVDTGADAMLWWIYGFTANDIYAVGERGLILHYDGQTWQRVESGTDLTLYGVWGASGDDVWIVGGDPSEAGEAVVLRGSAGAFARVTSLPPDFAPGALFKAYGYAADDVMIVGSGGAVLRWNGSTWRREPTPTSEPLFSLWGRDQHDIYAVGGWASGAVLHFGGDGWTEVDDGAGSGLSGVFTAPDHPTIAVGPDSYILEIFPDGSQVEPELPALDQDTSFHGVWGDDTGTTYAVGGDLMAYPSPTRGVILRRR